MTLSEFKAWFEGYTEGLEGAPTKAQFDRIKEKVKEITGTPVTYPIYIDRYVRPYREYWGPNWYGVSTSGGTTGIGGATMGSIQGATLQSWNSSSNANAFDSHSAMYALGKAEAALN